MDGYDAMAMSYMGSPLPNIAHGDFLNHQMASMELPQPSPYDPDGFPSADEMSYTQPMSMRRFSSNQFEEPFPEMADMLPAGHGAFEAVAPDPLQQHHQQQQQQQEDASIDHGHKLLSFSMPVYNFTLLDYSLRRTSLSMTAQLHGMFFLAESPWTTSPTGEPGATTGGGTPLSQHQQHQQPQQQQQHSGPPPVAELTCYRRNLFQITGSITLPRTLRYIMTEQGDRIPILAQELTVSATESVEGNPVKIISVPWKTPAANAAQGQGQQQQQQQQPEDKTEKEPPAIGLDTMTGQDTDSDYATFSIAWKRLQFRIATANNGRRKELQQHFVLRLKIMATLSTGAKISICETQSGPIIVRGRSPRNFQSRKDLPLSGSAAASRKNTQAAAALARSNAAAVASLAGASKTGKLKVEPDRERSTSTYNNNNQDWSTSTYNNASQDRSDGSRTFKRRRLSSSVAPIALSFVDEEGSAGSPRSIDVPPPASLPEAAHDHDEPDPSKARKRPAPLYHHAEADHRQHQPLVPAIIGAGDGPEALYEYFPLALDEWQAPVDAVYRPHVVHHTGYVDDMAAKTRSKRYFAEEAS
ncbi:hypothetical protein MauCBS54593_004447 [Microsporum audouinii]